MKKGLVFSCAALAGACVPAWPRARAFTFALGAMLVVGAVSAATPGAVAAPSPAAA